MNESNDDQVNQPVAVFYNSPRGPTGVVTRERAESLNWRTASSPW